MIGNVALDVVIGLVFIYLLYSLYATVIMEIVSSLFGLRARNLCYALSRMLMDEKKYSSSFQELWARTLTTVMRIAGKSRNQKNPHLYQRFFDQPSIKYLSSGGIGNKPSYLSAQNFSKGIIDSLKVDRPEVSELLRIQEGLALWREIIEEKGNEPPSETLEQIQSMLDDANNDLVKFKILLENWYNDTMDRASGWFKQSTQAILIVVGFILAISFDVDTIAIVRKLSNDTEARDQLVQMAVSFSENNAGLMESIRDSDKIQSVQMLDKRLESLGAISKTLNDDIKRSRNIIAPDSIKSSFWGYLLTVLALSLGAPFWFDLLNKLVKLRTSTSALGKPEGESGSTASQVPTQTILNRAG